MNIFVLHEDPVKAAQDQCDKHVVKMVLESAQMLSTAHRILDGDNVIHESLYKIAHKGHPCTKWVMESVANYQWLYDHFIGLCDEYTYRYGKTHLCDTKFRDILLFSPNNIPIEERTPFALAMSAFPQFMDYNDPVTSYRRYYGTKADNFNLLWTKREIPDWYFREYTGAF